MFISSQLRLCLYFSIHRIQVLCVATTTQRNETSKTIFGDSMKFQATGKFESKKFSIFKVATLSEKNEKDKGTKNSISRDSYYAFELLPLLWTDGIDLGDVKLCLPLSDGDLRFLNFTFLFLLKIYIFFLKILGGKALYKTFLILSVAVCE